MNAQQIIDLARSIFLHVKTVNLPEGFYNADEAEILEFARRIEEFNKLGCGGS